MVDKDFCLSSYIALRYIYDDNYNFYDNLHHKNYKLLDTKDKVFVSNAEEIYDFLKNTINKLYEKYTDIGILLSGGMDSGILSSYLKPGSHAYTFSNSSTDIYNPDIERVKIYCERFNLQSHLVDIDFEDYKKYTPLIMKNAGSPVHSIEPQIYKAAIQAKKDGVELMLIGDAADYIFGGMDKLLSKDWTFDEFVNRYCLLDPKLVLINPVDIKGVFEPYRKGNNIDFTTFISDGPMAVESYGSYENAFDTAGLKYFDPYERFALREPLDLERIRKGDTKYLIRELYRKIFPDISVPEKIPMPRPVEMIFKDWQGPTRREFRQDIPVHKLTGNQKWQLWCAELFLNIYEHT